LAARAVVERHVLDVQPDYRELAARSGQPESTPPPWFDSVPLRPQGIVRKGARYEPHSIGLPLVAAPAYALGGAKAVECMVALLLAAAVALGYLLARRAMPDPWCASAALALGLSPPLVANSTAVLPEPVAAAGLAGAALCAARLREGPSRVAAMTCFVLLGLVPWLGLVFVPPAVVIAWSAIRSLRRAGRGFLALGATEVAFFLLALLIGLNQALFGGATPHSGDRPGVSATGADSLSDYLGRSWRIVAAFLDQHYGLIRWAPIAALIFTGAWVLYRAARERLGTAIAGLDEEYAIARMCGLAALATTVTVALFLPTLDHVGYPGRWLLPALPLTVPLIALGLRQSPRIGLVLALLSVGGSVWLWVDARSGGGLTTNRPSAPWGPLVHVFPEFHGGAWPYVLLAAVAAALAAPVVREELEVRRRLG
jgi:hypothetical protein